MTEFKLQDEDLTVNLELSHDRVCDLRKVGCEADFRALAARALRRARAAEIVAAWMCEELSEGQAASLLGWADDPIALREFRDRIARDCHSRWKHRGPAGHNGGPQPD